MRSGRGTARHDGWWNRRRIDTQRFFSAAVHVLERSMMLATRLMLCKGAAWERGFIASFRLVSARPVWRRGCSIT